MAVEQAGRYVRDNPCQGIGPFQKAQREYFADVRRRTGGTWKISDFVTLGSPLTYAHVLVVNDGLPLLASEQHAIAAEWLQAWWLRLDTRTKKIAEMFRARAAQRALPLCPPVTERENQFVYEPVKGGFSVPHHAAVFAAVRWTNIYAPVKWLLWGDVVGGPVAPLFGPGVRDVPLTGPIGKRWLAHTHYWDVAEAGVQDEHLVVLRAAVNLLEAEPKPPPTG